MVPEYRLSDVVTRYEPQNPMLALVLFFDHIELRASNGRGTFWESRTGGKVHGLPRTVYEPLRGEVDARCRRREKPILVIS